MRLMVAVDSQITVSEQEYDAFRGFLEDACGIVLGANKLYLVTSRLTGLMKEHGIESLAELVVKMEKPTESRLRDRVIDAMTTNETNWFRDTHP